MPMSVVVPYSYVFVGLLGWGSQAIELTFPYQFTKLLIADRSFVMFISRAEQSSAPHGANTIRIFLNTLETSIGRYLCIYAHKASAIFI